MKAYCRDEHDPDIMEIGTFFEANLFDEDLRVCPVMEFPAEPKRRIPHHQDLGQEPRYEKSFKTAMRLKEEQDLEDYFKEASTNVDITSAFSTSVGVAKKDEVVAEPDLNSRRK